MKKGAMFGLDARIALAIFGALSVISGAALYSAIQDAKATAILTDMNEFGKAWESYYLDTGLLLSKRDDSSNASSNFYILEVENLVTNANSVAKWKGPYTALTADNNYRLNQSYGGFAYVLTLNDKETWGDGSTTLWTPQGHCASGDKCYIWIAFNKFESQDALKAIDKKVDGTVDGDAGSFRWYYENATYKNMALLKYAPVKNPND